jgi:hypothetical protein
MHQATYPVQFSVDYPDRPLDRVKTLLRPVVAIPILLVLARSPGRPPSGPPPTGRRWPPAPAACCSPVPSS